MLKGIQLIADFFKLLIKAIEHGSPEAVRDCVSVAKAWLKDTVNEAGAVKISPWSLMAGSDPWKESRKVYYTIAAKWDGRL